MAEDIEIEEHDILVNPALRKLFPDLSEIKNEIGKFAEPRHNFKGEDCEQQKVAHVVKIESIVSYDNDKPMTVSNICETPTQEEEEERRVERNKIILGSKPVYYEEFFKKLLDRERVQSVNLCLEDMGPYLQSSNRYCKICLTLFPSVSSFVSHRNEIHGIVNAKLFMTQNSEKFNHRDKQTASKQKKLNINRKSQSKRFIQRLILDLKNLAENSKTLMVKNRRCFHCNKFFNSRKTLIKHLNGILNQCKKNKSVPKDKKDTKASSNHSNEITNTAMRNQLISPTGNSRKRNYVPKKTDYELPTTYLESVEEHCEPSEKEDGRQEIDKSWDSNFRIILEKYTDGHDSKKTHSTIQYCYQCPYCLLLYLQPHLLKIHAKWNHRVLLEPKDYAPNVFVQECKYCFRKYKSPRKFNAHVFKNHAYRVYKKVKVQRSCQIADEKHTKKDGINKMYRCSACSCYFSNETSCLEHLSSKHKVYWDWFEESDFDASCTYCPATCETPLLYNEHLRIIHTEYANKKFHLQDFENLNSNTSQVTADKELTLKSHQQENTKSSVKLYRCHICSYYLRTDTQYEFHLSTSHSITKREESLIVEKATFNPMCKYCLLPFYSPTEYNTHLSYKHRKHLNAREVSKLENRELKIKSVLDSREENKMDEHLLYKLILYKCYVCTCYFKTLYQLLDHLLQSHDFRCPRELAFDCFEPTNYDPKCRICKSKIPSPGTMNRHVLFAHRELAKTKICQPDFNQTQAPSTSSRSNESSQPLFILKAVIFQCLKCDIHFLSSTTATDHENHPEMLINWQCPICKLIFKEADRTLHERQHNNIYSQQLTVYGVTPGDLPKILFTCLKCYVHFEEGAFWNHSSSCENDAQTSSYYCKSCDIQIDDSISKTHETRHEKDNFKVSDFVIVQSELVRVFENNNSSAENEIFDKNKGFTLKRNMQTLGSTKINLEKGPLPLNFHNYSKMQVSDKIVPMDLKRTKEDRSDRVTKRISVVENILYNCKNCLVTVDTYDKMIEHCQMHFTLVELSIPTIQCLKCNIAIDSNCYEKHKTLHARHKNEDSFTVLPFDTFYFTSSNSIWTKHVLGHLQKEQRDNILNESIYKYECRVKMDIIQNGPSDLTVYKCNRCKTIISNTHLLKHAETSCFKIRKLECSVCSLPFQSCAARLEHEKIHSTTLGITYKSYRIVSFNSEADKYFNRLLYDRSKYFVLYRCRNCDVVTDKLNIKNHKCSSLECLQTCHVCSLLVGKADYEMHIMRHKEIANFIQKNIKLILFGENAADHISNTNQENEPFLGKIKDYTLYRCSTCNLTVTVKERLRSHKCDIAARIRCHICEQCLSDHTHRKHLRQHEKDLDFTKENMRILDINNF